MTQEEIGEFTAGNLFALTRHATANALQSGALKPFETVATWYNDRGMDFLIRRVSAMRRKPRNDPSQNKPPANPFLPYDPDMHVTDISRTHVALLNKFPVVTNHLLLVTRKFVHQTKPLDLTDFEALAIVLREFDSLGFYNSGPVAGASQSHRHLQVIPLPLDADHRELDLDTRLLVDAASAHGVRQSERVPFEHRWTTVHCEDSGTLMSAYGQLLAAYGWSQDGELPPYNLLVRPNWMMLIPRRAEECVGVSLNAMAYAGQLLVKTTDEEAALLEHGLMQMLIDTAGELP